MVFPTAEVAFDVIAETVGKKPCALFLTVSAKLLRQRSDQIIAFSGEQNPSFIASKKVSFT